MIVVLVLQETNSNAIIEGKENEALNERNNRDSIISVGITAGVDSSRKKLFQDISKAFADQGVRLDFVTRELEKIKNSSKITEPTSPDAKIARTEIEAMRYPLDRLDLRIVFDKASSKSDLTKTNIRIYILDSTSEKATREIYSIDKLNAWDLAKDGIKPEYEALHKNLLIEEGEITEEGNYYIVYKAKALYQSWTPNRKIKSIKDLSKAGIIVTIRSLDTAIVPRNITFLIPTKDQMHLLHFITLTNPKYSPPLYIYQGYIKPGQVEVALREF